MLFPLENLNPHKFRKIAENEFRFINSSKSEYQVYFSDGSSYFENEKFSEKVNVFGFRPLSTSKPKVDKRTIETIVYILVNQLLISENIVLYVCDEKDYRQANRNKLFDLWFKKYNNGYFEKFNLVFFETTYLSAIISKENTFYGEFIESFPKVGENYK